LKAGREDTAEREAKGAAHENDETGGGELLLLLLLLTILHNMCTVSD
jgi:hypothetical protein